uniref:Uncharacterized protein n=1 Tax=Triticum urartu TaxID=4572 RepID=A0A8R7V5V8_TRIUA
MLPHRPALRRGGRPSGGGRDLRPGWATASTITASSLPPPPTCARDACLLQRTRCMKDAEETGSMACSCCKALDLHVHVSSSREFENTHTTASRRSIHPVMDPSGTSH